MKKRNDVKKGVSYYFVAGMFVVFILMGAYFVVAGVYDNREVFIPMLKVGGIDFDNTGGSVQYINAPKNRNLIVRLAQTNGVGDGISFEVDTDSSSSASVKELLKLQPTSNKVGQVRVGGNLVVDGNVNGVREEWGVVTGDGRARNSGSGGWSSGALTGTGKYKVTFDNPCFSLSPTIVVSAETTTENSPGRRAWVHKVDKCSAEVHVSCIGGTECGAPFHFIAKGKV